MLVVYDQASGRISQIVTHAESGLQAIKALHDAMGAGTLIVQDVPDFIMSFVKDGAVVRRPDVEVSGYVEDVAADGGDEIPLAFKPACKLDVLFAGAVIHSEAAPVAFFPISVTQPGEYTIRLYPEFPYLEREIKVTAE